MTMLVVLAIAALLTSILSAVIGMGGGVLLLATMLCFLDHASTIPAHGAVQLVSNSTRLVAFRRHIHRPTILAFALGATPGAAIAAALLWWLRRDAVDATEPWLKLAIGLYVLIITFKTTQRTAVTSDRPPPFLLFGVLSGLLGLTIGAVGPLIAPLFLRSAMSKEQVIATKATCQAWIHFLKIPALLATGWVAYGDLAQLIGVMAAMVIPGTLIGRRLLRHVSEVAFRRLYVIALVVAGSKVLVVDGLWPLWRGAA